MWIRATRDSDRKGILINLDNVDCLVSAIDTHQAIVYFTGDKEGVLLKESMTTIRNKITAAMMEAK